MGRLTEIIKKVVFLAPRITANPKTYRVTKNCRFLENLKFWYTFEFYYFEKKVSNFSKMQKGINL